MLVWAGLREPRAKALVARQVDLLQHKQPRQSDIAARLQSKKLGKAWRRDNLDPLDENTHLDHRTTQGLKL